MYSQKAKSLERKKYAHPRGADAAAQGDLHLPGHDTDQRQCAMEWPTIV
jgi:hypothetical protein